MYARLKPCYVPIGNTERGKLDSTTTGAADKCKYCRGGIREPMALKDELWLEMLEGFVFDAGIGREVRHLALSWARISLRPLLPRVHEETQSAYMGSQNETSGRSVGRC